MSCSHFFVGNETTAGSQAAVKWSAYQTSSEDHEISAAAEGVLMLTMIQNIWL